MTRARGRRRIGHQSLVESPVRFVSCDGTGRVVDENDDDDDAICQRFCKHDDDDDCDGEKQRAWTSRGTPDDARARGDEYWGVSGVFPARGGGTHGTGGD